MDRHPRLVQPLDMLRRNSLALAQVAGELADFAVIEQGAAEPLGRGMHSRALDLAVLVDTTMAWFEEEAKAKSINLYKTIPDNLPAVFASSVQLQQILYCLIDNALAFTRHGYVEVSASVPPAERPAARRQVLVQVRDTGRGMNQAELDNLWHRLERRRRRESDLDLVRARRLVALQGGELQVQSVPQQGSTFGFTLPIAD
jgi:two-component system sensor histidine kinase BarA